MTDCGTLRDAQRKLAEYEHLVSTWEKRVAQARDEAQRERVEGRQESRNACAHSRQTLSVVAPILVVQPQQPLAVAVPTMLGDTKLDDGAAGNARIETVGQSQSCMVSKLPIVARSALRGS